MRRSSPRRSASSTPDDPYEGLNRRLYISGDKHIFLPIAKLYHALTPGPIGEAVHNMLTNLSEPLVVANDILQARLPAGARDTARFVTNATVGIGGMIDVASRHGLQHHENDFGITLGVWGVRPGPYVFLPFLGPSTVRDGIGLGVDVLLNPLTYMRFPGHLTLEYTTIVVGGLDQRIRVLQVDYRRPAVRRDRSLRDAALGLPAVARSRGPRRKRRAGAAADRRARAGDPANPVAGGALRSGAAGDGAEHQARPGSRRRRSRPTDDDGSPV